MKVLITLLIIPFLTIVMEKDKETSLYDFKQTAIRGGEVEMSEFKGQVLLIVNTASKCGYTPQYEALQSLQEKYSDSGFTVLAFPANNFAGQEPGSDEEIEEFCTVNFNTTFPLFSRTSVKGEDINPMFSYLTSIENEDFTGEIKWNFEKFLIDRNGNLVRRFRSNVTPDSEEIVGAIEKELN
jgi:glutathione peroxidase